MTTTTEDRKMTPTDAMAIVQEFRADLAQWDKFLGSRWLTQPRELDEDYGELDRLGGSSRNLLVVLDMFGDNPALNDNAVDEMRAWCRNFTNRDVLNLRQGYCERLAPALEAVESGLQALGGAKAAVRDDMMRARWFHERTDGVLTADQLSKAYRAKRIVGEKRGGRNYYSVVSVIAIYPEHAPTLKTEKH